MSGTRNVQEKVSEIKEYVCGAPSLIEFPKLDASFSLPIEREVTRTRAHAQNKTKQNKTKQNKTNKQTKEAAISL